jgi:hypothetical protein
MDQTGEDEYYEEEDSYGELNESRVKRTGFKSLLNNAVFE